MTLFSLSIISDFGKNDVYLQNNSIYRYKNKVYGKEDKNY